MLPFCKARPARADVDFFLLFLCNSPKIHPPLLAQKTAASSNCAVCASFTTGIERFLMYLILISDRKVGNDFRDRIVPGEAKRAEHNGHIWSRASTKLGAILTGKNPRFLLEISIRLQKGTASLCQVLCHPEERRDERSFFWSFLQTFRERFFALLRMTQGFEAAPYLLYSQVSGVAPVFQTRCFLRLALQKKAGRIPPRENRGSDYAAFGVRSKINRTRSRPCARSSYGKAPCRRL